MTDRKRDILNKLKQLSKASEGDQRRSAADNISWFVIELALNFLEKFFRKL